MAGRSTRRRRRGRDRGEETGSEERRFLQQAAGVAVLIAAAMFAFPTATTVYRFLNRADYAKTKLEVLTTPAGPKHTIRVRVLSDQREYTVRALDFPELHSGGVVVMPNVAAGQSFEVWYNRGARKHLDHPLLSVKAHPDLVTGTGVLVHLTVAVSLVLLGAFLATAPYRKR